MSKREIWERVLAAVSSVCNVAAEEIFGDAEHWAFCKVLMSDPKTAEAWLAKIEAVEWNNYLSEAEAKMIATKLVNQDGAAGAKWDKATFLTVVSKNDGEAECAPYYNGDALWVTAMMIYSDHAKSIAEDMGCAAVSEVPAEKMAMSVYRKAVESLKDKDRKYSCVRISQSSWDEHPNERYNVRTISFAEKSERSSKDWMISMCDTAALS